MKIFIARASGAIGSQLVPQLAGGGHEAVGTTRGISNENTKRELDWTPQYPSWRTGFTEGWS